MACPKYCIQVAIAIIGTVYVLLGLLFMHLGIAANYNTSLQLLDYEKIASYFMVFAGGVMILAAGIGCTAAAQKSEPLAFVFGYISLAVFLLFSSIGFSLLIARATITSTINNSCQTGIGLFHEIDQIYTQGSQLLCTEKCPCTGEIGVTNKFGASTLQGCPASDLVYTSAMKEEYGKYLVLLETQFECSGMCQAVGNYMFTGTERGAPKTSCQNAIISKVIGHAGEYSGITLGFSAIGLAGLVASITIFYVERRKFIPEQHSKYADWGLKEN